MRKRLSIVFAVIALQGVVSAQSQPTEMLTQKARSLEARGRYDLAGKAWQQVLMMDAGQQEALAGLARAAKQTGRESEAKVYLDRLRKANPAHPAISEVESIIKTARNKSQLDEAAKLAQAGKFTDAVAAYKIAFGGNPPPSDWVIPYYETLASTPGGWEQATLALSELVRKHPSEPEYKLSLGRLYTYRPASRKAGLDLLQSASADPAFARRAQQPWRQALIWEDGSQRSEASLRSYLTRYPEPALEALVKKHTRPTAPGVTAGPELQRAYKALQQNELASAEEQFNKIYQTNPTHPGAAAGLGFIRMKQQDFAQAVKQFEIAQSNAPGNKTIAGAFAEARFWLAMQEGAKALKQTRGADAEALFQKALIERPASLEAQEGLAGAFLQRGNSASAIPILERVLEADATRLDAWQNLIRAKHQKAGPADALEVAARIPPAAAEKLGQNLGYLVQMASIYRNAGRLADSRASFDNAIRHIRLQKTGIAAGVQLELALLYQQHGQPMESAALYHRVIDAQPGNLDAWEGFLLAMRQANVSAEAKRVLERLPPSAFAAAQARPGFLRAVAAIESDLGKRESAESLLVKAQALETLDGKQASPHTLIQLAQLQIEMGRHTEAARRFSALTQSEPANTEAWKGLILAHFNDKRFNDAQAAAEAPKEPVRARLLNDPDYLSTLASIHNELGNKTEALRMIRQAASIYQSEGRKMPPAQITQFGWLLVSTAGTERELFLLLRSAQGRADFTREQHTVLGDIWVTWIMQSASSARTKGDPERAIAILEAGVRMYPANRKIQRTLAGYVLNSGNTRRALAIYKEAGMNEALPSDYLAGVGTALSEQDNRSAKIWLAEALQKYPRDPELLNLAAKQAAAKGDFRKAEALWRAALQRIEMQEREKQLAVLRADAGALPDLKLNDPTDYMGTLLMTNREQAEAAQPEAPAARNALSYKLPWEQEAEPVTPPAQSVRPSTETSDSHSSRQADHLLTQLLGADGDTGTPIRLISASTDSFEARQAPASAQFLAGQQAPEPRAVSRPALRQPAPNPPAPPVATPKATSRQELDELIGALSTPESRSDLRRQLSDEPAPGLIPASPRSAPSPEPALPAFLMARSAEASADYVEPSEASLEHSKRNAILDHMQMMESRNTPYVGLGGAFLDRGGEAGFARMMVQESNVESSTMLTGRIRLTLLARSVFADSGSPDGQSELRFGMLPAGDTFETRSVNGFGAEAQLSGENFGVRFGSTPRGFPVRNIIGGARFQPGGGPITITFERDAVRDTLLSYAGARDPLSRRVWGGVIANTAALAGNFGAEKSGAYFNIGFHHITGQSVQTNRRVDGTMGVYWRLLSLPVGSLNAGANLFAMHYQRNLRFFTLGHGGYFSPQRFMLFAVPITWTGRWKQLEYKVASSVGSQSFTEDASPFFPIDSALQGKTGPYYPAFSSTGINYNLDFRASYQLAENWFLGAYANVNNARFYSVQSAGIFIKYAFKPRPLNTEFSLQSVPDWRGRQPFGLP